VVVAVAGVEGKENEKKKTQGIVALSKTVLVNSDPIHYHILPSNKPHPCDKYGCQGKPNTNLATTTTTALTN
jgi:hypothetical protein